MRGRSVLRVWSGAVVVAVVLALGAGACSDGRGEAAAPPAPPEEEGRGEVTFVSLGTDETEANELGFPDSVRSSWNQLLFREALPRRAVHVNLGEQGSSVADALREQLPVALELDPTLAGVWLTATDSEKETSPGAYEEDLDQLVEALQQGGRTQVLLATSSGDAPAPALDAAVERVAQARGADLVDLRDVDGPLDLDGHAAVADAFAAALGEVR
ncbi:MAG: SGNH/GDSL hydrolase family protein [Acidimicrobiia bacterium]|nr:SGNH/GDSL hydrolase family protein [Acidimicrobiia bacterium]